MHRWLDDRVHEIRQRMTPDDEASMWIVCLDDPYGEPVVAAAVTDAMAHIDRHMTENLAMIIDGVGAKAVLLAIPRRDGTPRAEDRRLWRDLEELLIDSPTELTDLLVVRQTRFWSANESME